MTSLEKMLNDIEQEALAQSKKKIEEAHKKATQTLKNAKTEAEEKAAQMLKEADVVVEKLLKKIESETDLEKRKIILSAKQDAMISIIDEAKMYLLNLPNEKYFEVMLWMLSKALREKSEYTLALSMHDRERLTEDFIEKMNSLAQNKGTKVMFDLSPANITGGFILKNGGVEQNYSIEALFEQYHDELCDMLKEFLFSDEGK